MAPSPMPSLSAHPQKLWVDGSLVPMDAPVVPGCAAGLTVGLGVFETLRMRRGNVLWWPRHWARLEQSAATLGLRLGRPHEAYSALQTVAEANGLSDSARLRLTVVERTANFAHPALDRAGLALLLATAVPLPQWPAAATVVTAPWIRPARSFLSGVKTTSYAESVLAQRWAQAQGADEALWLTEHGDISEGSGSNIFIVKGGQLFTPPLSSGCLPGVTRGLIIDTIAIHLGLTCSQEPLSAARLRAADEIFLTSSTRLIHRVGTLDGQARPLAAPLTDHLRQAYLTAEVDTSSYHHTIL
jgi:branched-chain amino acid aminotransferase